MKPLIYFFIPVHNEQDTVGVLLYRLIQVMREIDMEYEVHLTLDGCTDESAQVVEPYMKKMPLLVTQHETRQGYGKCLGEAIRKIGGASQNPKRDFFVVLDADFSIDPVELKEMASGIERNTVLYLPDRLSVTNNKIGVARRMANRMAHSILRRRGAEFPAGIDLFATFRGCRVHHLRRNMPRLDALTMLDAGAPPAVSAALLYLALQDNSKKTDVLEIREQKMRRGPGRFSLKRTLRRLMFSRAVARAIEQFEGGRDGGGDSRRRDRRPGERRDHQGRDQRDSGGERSGSRRSPDGSRRRGRGRRGRRSGGSGGDTASRQGQDSRQDRQSGAQDKRDKQAQGQSQRQSKGKEAQGGGESGGKARQDGEQRSGSRRSRRRRRRPNKRSQDSSNTPRKDPQAS